MSEANLRAYVEERLSAADRRAVEGYLACNPDVAADVMAAAHVRRGNGVPPLRRRSIAFAAALLLGIVGCAGLAYGGETLRNRVSGHGWVEADGDLAPGYVAEAAMSARVAQLRAKMVSQPDIPLLDLAEVTRFMRLRLPALPAGWHLIDVQVFPSDDGPGLSLVSRAPDGRRMDLFAVRADTVATNRPEIARRGGHAMIFWEAHDTAFVLSGDASVEELLGAARMLAQS